MTAKEYLLQIKKYDYIIKNKLEQIRHWKAVACDVSVNYGDIKVKSSRKIDKIGEAVAKYVDLEKEVEATIRKAIKEREKIISTIEQLPVDYYDLLHKMYVQGMDIQTIASKLDRSYTCITTRHKRALESLQKIIDNK